MIDERKLITYLEKERNYWLRSTAPHSFEVMCMYGDIIDFVNEQPKGGEWIPCSERPPDEEAKEFIKEHLNGIGYLYPCLLTYRSPNTEKINVVRFYYDLYQNWFVNLGEEPCEKDRCLAWQPLPEPWKGEDDV